MTDHKIKILACDDHQIFVDGLKNTLEKEKNFGPVATALNGDDVLKAVDADHIDVVLMDIEMPGVDGIEATRQISKSHPEVKVIALSMHDDSNVIRKMIQAGAKGYLIKNAGFQELVQAINTVNEGGQYFKGAVLNRIIDFSEDDEGPDPWELLTDREIEVLKLIAAEKSNLEIASELFISVHTVSSHRKNMIKKLGVKNSAGLLKYAVQKGL